MRNMTRRAIAVATAGTVALTCVLIEPVVAAPATAPAVKQEQAGGMTDVSSGHRQYRGGDRAAIGAMLGIVGTIGAIAAANNYRRHYDYYDGGPYAYDGAGPYGGYYNHGGPRFHGLGHHHHWHR